MSRHAAAVVVVSARTRDGYRGLTASSFAAASLEPPLVVVALERHAATRDAVIEGREFNVSLLSRSQEFVADRLSGRAPALEASWSEVPHRLGANGIPIIEGAVAWAECRLVASHDAGDHDLCVGEVTAAGAGAGDPLILWDRRFWTVG